MRTSTAIIWIIIIIVVILGGWWWYTSTQTTDTGASMTAGLNGSSNQGNLGEASTTPAVSVASSTALGQYLVASNGMTLYEDSNDTSGVSNCTGSCAQTWPPYAPSGTAPLIGASGVSGTLSTITRDDGTQQVTYNGLPLYFYNNDLQPGDTTGQGVGGIWSVARP